MLSVSGAGEVELEKLRVVVETMWSSYELKVGSAGVGKV